ncbi:MAG TPA: DNA cytosine methyltransferase [Roseiarcus sp.]|jgi:DNA (cytosine-5)-methyltransferase 1|nr:DNA cytosine methyltransferase [Roseiarcus sp.]
MSARWNFFEGFAGGGMVRLGLGSNFQCLMANDMSPAKAASYAANFGSEHLHVCDVAELTTDDIPAGRVGLAWASFPCQDISLAGDRAGLNGARSSVFWDFWRLVQGLRSEGRAPKIVVIENIDDLVSSHGGRDFEAIRIALVAAGYRFGAVIIDAALFVPQSRRRVFIIGVDQSLPIPASVTSPKPVAAFCPYPLAAVCDPLSDPRWNQPRSALDDPLWFRLPVPPIRNTTLANIIEDDPAPAPAKAGVRWHTQNETARLMAMMAPGHIEKIETAKRAGKRMAGGLYRRTRPTKDGGKVSRWEIRFDGLAGCLRIPTGGSSRQTIMIVEGDTVRSRLLSPREAARLMGLPDDYLLPVNVNEALALMGDGVVVPVVRFLAENILEPILAANSAAREAAGTQVGFSPPIDPWGLARSRGQAEAR